jgi:hypothetical protein
MTPELIALAERQALVFSAAQAQRAGFTSHHRRQLVRSGVFHELRRGIYALDSHWAAADDRGRHRIALAGALLIRKWTPDESEHRYVGGLRTAAFLLGLPFQPDADVVSAIRQTTDFRDLTPEAKALVREVSRIRRGKGPSHIDLVSADRCRRTSRHGVHVRPAALPDAHIVLDNRVPITSIARTTADLMREGTEIDALIAADGALHRGVPRAELEWVVRFCATWSNGRQALVALAFANGLAESAAESLARWVCAQERRIPRPELQVELFDEFGLIGRVDLLFRSLRVALEVDGYIKYTDPWCGDAIEALRLQHERESRLRAAGWTVVRTTWDELINNPAGFLRRLLAAFAAAA